VLATLQRWLYSLARIACAPVFIGRLWWRGREEPLLRKRLGERLARYELPPRRGSGGVVWVHADGADQVRGASPLVEALRRELPSVRVLLTCTEASGVRAGLALLKPEDDQAWLPHDTPGAARRFLKRYRPAVGVVMEAGLWPNLMRQARAMHVPMTLANARLSTRELRQRRGALSLWVPAVASFSRVLAQTPRDAQHWRDLGARTVEICGNGKFDAAPAAVLVARGKAWREVARRRVVLLLDSRAGEEAALFDAWRALPAPRPLLMVAPHDARRTGEIDALAEAAGFGVAHRREWTSTPSARSIDADVWLADGGADESALYLAFADVALQGGSFGPHGGGSPIEAAACGCPLLLGPNHERFEEAVELAIEAGAAARVKDLPSAVRRAAALVDDPRRAEWVEQSLAFAASHRGANERMAQRIAMLLTGLESVG
jgi:3-deoxy-D-manno-octulosonic-acid transferase